MHSDLMVTVLGVVLAVAFSGLGWLLRRWINGLTKLVNSRGDNIEGQVDAVATHLQLLDNKVTNTQISVAEVRGKLGMAMPPEPVAAAHPWGNPR